jgi:hypothetical protein
MPHVKLLKMYKQALVFVGSILLTPPIIIIIIIIITTPNFLTSHAGI